MNISKLFDGKKIDVIGLVQTIETISERLDRLEKGLREIKEIVSGASVLPSPPDKTELLELDPELWMEPAKSFIGLDEDADEAQVIELSEKAGTPITSSETPWCAIFVNAILAMAGLKTTGTMRARDFAEYGEACEEKFGAIVVYKSHVGFVSEIGKVLGGNQSDGVNIGEQSWYGKPIAYRWPTEKKR